MLKKTNNSSVWIFDRCGAFLFLLMRSAKKHSTCQAVRVQGEAGILCLTKPACQPFLGIVNNNVGVSQQWLRCNAFTCCLNEAPFLQLLPNHCVIWIWYSWHKNLAARLFPTGKHFTSKLLAWITTLHEDTKELRLKLVNILNECTFWEHGCENREDISMRRRGNSLADPSPSAWIGSSVSLNPWIPSLCTNNAAYPFLLGTARGIEVHVRGSRCLSLPMLPRCKRHGHRVTWSPFVSYGNHGNLSDVRSIWFGLEKLAMPELFSVVSCQQPIRFARVPISLQMWFC